MFNRRGLRLVSGVVLFAYVGLHLANHAVGLVSLAAAEAARLWFVGVWRSAPMTVLLYAAIATHIVLAFAALYERRTLRMPPTELLRLVFGFSIPFFLASHVTATRLAHQMYGVSDAYADIVKALWTGDGGVTQVAMMSVAWAHGCMGLHFVLRRRPGYQGRFYLLFAGALLLPVLAALGFVSMARDPALESLLAPATGARDAVAAAHSETLGLVTDGLRWLAAAALAGVFLARGVRARHERRRGFSMALTYPGRTVRVPLGWSVLEASRANGIEHLSMCGGRARCSTCRVRVGGDLSHCPAPSPMERRTLQRIGAAVDVRLACQLRPTGDLQVTPMLSQASARGTFARPEVEHDVAILFVDLRRWTSLSEQHLPHDLAYVLDHYFAAVGDAVREAGGVPNQFIGDSVMAIFGMECSIEAACRQALDAAHGIESRMAQVNERMQREFGHAFGFGIGIHAGRAAVGEVGYRETRTLTAVGDIVNTASRLQELCKLYEVQLVISERVAVAAELDPASMATHALRIRGRRRQMKVFAIARASELSTRGGA